MSDQVRQQVEEKLRIENRFKNGSGWFFWIAGLSLLNSILLRTGGGLNFLFGLGATQLVDDIGMQLANSAGSAGIIAFAINLAFSGLFIMFGVFARKKQNWAFIIGMLLYALDGLLFLQVKDYLSLGFHVFALYCLFDAFKASNILKKMENDDNDDDLEANCFEQNT